MSVDKLVDSTQLNEDLTSVANAIRTKGGTSVQLAFPAGFVSAIDAIPTGGGVQIATGTVIGDDTTIVKFACSFLPDVVYVKRIDTTVLSSRVFGGFIGFSNGTVEGKCLFQNNADTLNFSNYTGSLTDKGFSLSDGVVMFTTNLTDRKFSSECEYMYYAVKWTT